eukprot:5481114-Pyramimonas_sp.AAC.1
MLFTSNAAQCAATPSGAHQREATQRACMQCNVPFGGNPMRSNDDHCTGPQNYTLESGGYVGSALRHCIDFSSKSGTLLAMDVVPIRIC